MNTPTDAFFSITPAQYAPCQMSVSEVRELIEESEQRLANGIFVSESEMDAFFDSLQ